ncbi:MlaD family protein [Mycobacterium vicinigordonae]|uniref:MCE family protein n=1 Tax=Mycobacterium vicinigordonae TaxID=1719132 RepID=A0A7D6E070_9MYCO|nr:MlaD family protein [Mycobacterium vicinigordonae]QLL08708.1 MCE family protein [Mycobacterium vicinigordonae]
MIAFVLGYFATSGVRVAPPADRLNLSIDVTDINSLALGSNVLLRGVAVGKVTDIRTDANSATVGFYVDPGFRIPLDSEIRLENLSALGESYIALLPRSEGGPLMRDGEHLSTEAVVQPPSISQLAASVVRVLKQLNPEELDGIIAAGDEALPDPVKVLPNLSRASILARNTIDDLGGSGRELLDNFQVLLRNSAFAGPLLTHLSPSLTDASKGLQELWRENSILVYRGQPGLFVNTAKIIARLQELLDNRGSDLKVLGEAFQPKLNDISGALMNFDTGQMLTNLLATVPADGAITLRVVP